VASGIGVLLLLLLAAFLIIPRVGSQGVGPGVFAGLALGLLISFAAVMASIKLLRFR
jgi:hypothetical protein